MKVFYLSSHGFGHIIRTIPFLLEILENTNEQVYLVCDHKQIEFLKAYFMNYKNRIIYREMTTDIGFVNYENSITVNREATIQRLEVFLSSLDQVVTEEYNRLKDFAIDEIYIDISLIGIKVSKLLGVKSIMMTNFTWYKQYETLDFPQEIIHTFKTIESMVDELWVYPLAFPFEHITSNRKQLDYQSRPFDWDKIEALRKNHSQIITVFTGMSASSGVKIKNYKGLLIHSEHIQVDYDGPKLVLDARVLDSHNYIAASDFVITKSGWTTVSECIKANTKMVLIERPSAYEDTYIINQVKQLGYGMSIKEENLQDLDIQELYIRTRKA
jgi:hypothetical protein